MKKDIGWKSIVAVMKEEEEKKNKVTAKKTTATGTKKVKRK